MRVDGEDVDQLEGGEDVGGGKQTLRELGERDLVMCLTSDISVGSQVSHFSLGRLMVLMPREDSCWTCSIISTGRSF